MFTAVIIKLKTQREEETVDVCHIVVFIWQCCSVGRDSTQ